MIDRRNCSNKYTSNADGCLVCNVNKSMPYKHNVSVFWQVRELKKVVGGVTQRLKNAIKLKIR